MVGLNTVRKLALSLSATLCLSGLVALIGCADEYEGPVEADVTTEAPEAAPKSNDVDDAMNAGRSSTLGRARDTAENTEAVVDQYNAELEKALEED